MNTEIKYRTFDQLLDSVLMDMKRFDLEGIVEPQSLIKVALRINHLLGLKINTAHEVILDIHGGKAKLPDDFHVLNFALACGGTKELYNKEYTYIVPHCNEIITIPSDCGEDIVVSPRVQLVYESYTRDSVCSTSSSIKENDCNSAFVGMTNNCKNNPLCLESKSHARYIHDLIPMQMVKPNGLSPECYNKRVRCSIQGYIKDNYLIVNFDEGRVYFNYQGVMENADGELLVMDHPKVNDFYEYSIKERITENMLVDSEDVARIYQLYAEKVRVSRIEALSYMRTPDFGELKTMWETNRKAMMHKYYSMFI